MPKIEACIFHSGFFLDMIDMKLQKGLFVRICNLAGFEA